MPTSYDQIAGHSAERLAALSDGIFAVAMTLLVLDLRAPAIEAIHNEAGLWKALLMLSPRLIVYMMTFMTLGIFWIGQQTQLNHLHHSNRSLSWLHIAFLFLVSIMPFSTALLSEFTHYWAALVVYWVNILLLGSTLYVSWVCAEQTNLVKPDLSSEISVAIKRRIVVAQTFYAIGVSFCFFSTYLSIAFIMLVQLNYAIAPRWTNRFRA